MSSSFPGDLVNGVFFVSSNVSFTAFGFPGTVVITVMQQTFGMTMAVSYIVLLRQLQVAILLAGLSSTCDFL